MSRTLLVPGGMLLVVITGFQNCSTMTAARVESSLSSGTSYCVDNQGDATCAKTAAVVDCAFNGGVYGEGQSVSAYLNSNSASCIAETRVCHAGSFSGSYQFATCTVNANAACLFNGQTVPDGGSVQAYLSSVSGDGQACQVQTRTCANGALSGSWSFASCTPTGSASCLFDGRTIAHGASVLAYTSGSVAAGQKCASNVRTCLNGSLSGIGDYSSCAMAAAPCLFNGQTLSDGQSVLAYDASTTAAGGACQSNVRTCANGVLSGLGDFAVCSSNGASACLINGQSLASGQSITLYTAANADHNGVCGTETRLCTGGILSGSATFSSCQANSPNVAGCVIWPSGATDLQTAVTTNSCVQVAAGLFDVPAAIVLSNAHRLLGLGRDRSVLRAASTYVFSDSDALIGTQPGTTDVRISDLTLDGAGLATYLVGFDGIDVEDSNLINGRCTAVGIVGPGMIAKRNLMDRNSQPIVHPTRGHVGCETVPDNWDVKVRGPYGGLYFGAAIVGAGYTGVALNSQPVLTNNEIMRTYGPALDNSAIWGGTFSNNSVHDNDGWAAVSLWGSSQWTIMNNVINHPRVSMLLNGQPDSPQGQPYHVHCGDPAPWGGHPAAIFLCEDTDDGNQVTTHNLIQGNTLVSYFGILSIGNSLIKDGGKPYWAPRFNQFLDNFVNGSDVGCVDGYLPNQSDSNVWRGNTCGGTPNSGPALIKQTQ